MEKIDKSFALITELWETNECGSVLYPFDGNNFSISLRF